MKAVLGSSDCPDMKLAIDRECKTQNQTQNSSATIPEIPLPFMKANFAELIQESVKFLIQNVKKFTSLFSKFGGSSRKHMERFSRDVDHMPY